MLFLTACAGGISRIVVVKIECPEIVKYDAMTQDQALAELSVLPKGSALRQFIGDYKRLRDQITVCRDHEKIKQLGN